MVTMPVHKVVGALPPADQLTANAIYIVRAGSGIEIYVSNQQGDAAHKLHALPEGAMILKMAADPIPAGWVSVTTFMAGSLTLRVISSDTSIVIPDPDPEPDPDPTWSILITADGFVVENLGEAPPAQITMTSDGFTITPSGTVV